MKRLACVLCVLVFVAGASATRLDNLRLSNASLTNTLDDQTLIKLAISSLTQAVQQLGADTQLDAAKLGAMFPLFEPPIAADVNRHLSQ